MTKLRYAWEPFLKHGKEMKINKNSFIYRQGEPGNGFYYLKSGCVKIIVVSNKFEERIVDFVPPGALLGVHGINNDPYLTSAIAISASIVYYFSDETLLKIYKEHPEAATIYINIVIEIIRLFGEIIHFFGTTIEQQMAYYLVRLCEAYESDIVQIDQTTFSQYVGKTRIAVNQVIQKWKQDGLIEFSTKGIQIINLDKLKEIGYGKLFLNTKL